MIFLLLCLAYFTVHDNLYVHPRCCKWHYFILFNVIYMYHIFFIHSSVFGHVGCFHALAIVNSLHFLEPAVERRNIPSSSPTPELRVQLSGQVSPTSSRCLGNWNLTSCPALGCKIQVCSEMPSFTQTGTCRTLLCRILIAGKQIRISSAFK